MNIVTFDEGAVAQLEAYFANNDLYLRLFTDNVVLVNSMAMGDLTEADGGGYAAILLPKTGWTIGVVNNIAQASCGIKSFAFAGPLNINPVIHGYYITNGARMIYGQNGNGPYTPSSSSDVLEIIPTYQLSGGIPTA
jgi:hypothetical protein